MFVTSTAFADSDIVLAAAMTDDKSSEPRARLLSANWLSPKEHWQESKTFSRIKRRDRSTLLEDCFIPKNSLSSTNPVHRLLLETIRQLIAYQAGDLRQFDLLAVEHSSAVRISSYCFL